MQPSLQTLAAGIGKELKAGPFSTPVWYEGILKWIDTGCIEMEYQVQSHMVNESHQVNEPVLTLIGHNLIKMATYSCYGSTVMQFISCFTEFYYRPALHESFRAYAFAIPPFDNEITVECNIWNNNQEKVVARFLARLRVVNGEW
jgi:hypothetical protein